MGRRPVENKKGPGDYPQMAFRVTAERKEQLNTEIEKIQKALNKKRKIGEPYINKNDVIIQALEVGLKNLK